MDQFSSHDYPGGDMPAVPERINKWCPYIDARCRKDCTFFTEKDDDTNCTINSFMLGMSKKLSGKVF